MISPDDLIGLAKLADDYDREAVRLAQGPWAQREIARDLFVIAAHLRAYVERNK